jgi:cell wall-associated NlpC family hydrolase
VFRRGLAALALTALAAGVLAVPAQASTPHPVGGLFSAVDDTFAHRLTLHGWAYDTTKSSASITVRLWVDGRYVGHAVANQASPYENKKHRISGKHDFTLSVAAPKTAKQVVLKSGGVKASAPLHTVGIRTVSHVYPAPGARIVAVAKRYVGKARYVDGGTSPKGFDCSGYTQYVYAQAKVKALPRTAEQQRHAKGMKLIPASKARPGDLVFYLSGGSAYHVAIYAGHGNQYAAATVRDGIRYQKVWSRSVQYGTDWH